MDDWNTPREERYLGLTPAQFNLAFFAIVGTIGVGIAIYFGALGAAGDFFGGEDPSSGAAVVEKATPTPAGEASPAPTLTPEEAAIPEDGAPPPAAESQGEEERVIAAVYDAYDYISDGNYEALWSTYTSAFRDSCSFDDMVVAIDEIRQSAGWDELAPTLVQVTVLDGQAVAAYVVEAKAGGTVIDRYDYDVTYFQEDGEWRAQETCY